MKKLSLILFLVSYLIFTCSCEDAVDGKSEELIVKMVDVSSSSWIINDGMMSSTISVSELMNDFFKKASVLVYAEIAGTWQLIPYKARFYSANGLDRLIRYTYSPGKVIVDIIDNDNLSPISLKLKIVIIPGI